MAEIANVALIFCVLLAAGLEANAMPYDYSAKGECLAMPEEAQYKGGIIENPELNDGTKGWSVFGSSKIEHRETKANKFIVAHTRNHSFDSFSRTIHLDSNLVYTFSAWVQVDEGTADVAAIIKTRTGFEHVGSTIAQSICWSFLKGGLTVQDSGPAELYFESNNTMVEIWVDSVSLQPFTQEQWRAHQDEAIEKFRKRRVKIQAVDREGNPLPNASISLRQWRPGFPVGCAINQNILNNVAYQNWFASRGFTATTFENEMKWYSTEQTQGRVDYSVPDAMMQFAGRHNLVVRGHNVFWDDERFQPGWVRSLSFRELYRAARRRINSIMSKYRGRLIAWDVENEDLHFRFFEARLGGRASGLFYNWAMKADGSIPLFLNDYNTIESRGDASSSPARYLQKLDEIRRFPGNSGGRFAIGLESHFGSPPDIAYMRSAIDTLGSAGVPIWLTEVDVSSMPNQAYYLEQVLREGFSHPKVNGIVIWSAWSPGGCYRMCLTDNNFHNLPTGDVVDKLLKEWGIKASITATTDANGFFEASLFHGDYDVQISHPSVTNSSLNAQKLSVVAASEGDSEQQSHLLVKVQI